MPEIMNKKEMACGDALLSGGVNRGCVEKSISLPDSDLNEDMKMTG